MKIPVTISLSRWPWQRRHVDAWTAMLGRFGGGWQYSLGIQISTNWKTIVLELVWGQVRIEFGRKA
jgi:hypothetical protein